MCLDVGLSKMGIHDNGPPFDNVKRQHITFMPPLPRISNAPSRFVAIVPNRVPSQDYSVLRLELRIETRADHSKAPKTT
jgi:hypothetical protein